MDDETIDIRTGLFLVDGVADRPERMQSSGPSPEGGEKPPQVLDIAVGGMARSAIDRAKQVETTLGDAGNWTAETSKEGPP